MIITTFCAFVVHHLAATKIYTLSLHDALPIWRGISASSAWLAAPRDRTSTFAGTTPTPPMPRRRSIRRRSEEHTSELQSHSDLVCRLLLEKKKYDQYHVDSNANH